MISFNKMRAGANPSVPDEPPFTIEHLRRDVTPSGSFTPHARLILSQAFRTSGLLPALPDNETRSLMALLAFLTANGRVEAVVGQVAELLQVSEAKALDRLRRLCRIQWRGEPVAHERIREDGTIIFGIADHVVGVHQSDATVKPNDEAGLFPNPVTAPAGRESIIAQSRAAYGRPRVEVEQEIAEQLGYLTTTVGEDESDLEISPAARRLLELGVAREQLNALLVAYNEAEIIDQLDWLPMRGAKNPARFIVAAIQNRYEPPARVRLERAIAAEEAMQVEQKFEAFRDLPVGESAALLLPDREESQTKDEK